MHYMRPFRCELLTSEREVAVLRAVSVVLPTADGLLGVLGGHSPLAMTLGAGPLTIEESGGGRREYFLAGGFAQVADDVLTILAEQCITPDQIDLEAAWSQIDNARKMPAGSDQEYAARSEAVASAQMMFRIGVRNQKSGDGEKALSRSARDGRG